MSLVLVLLSSPSAASAQFEYGLSLEPYGGVFFDGFRNDLGAGDPGWVGGVRFGYELGWAMGGAERALRLVLDGARAQTDEAGGGTVADSIDVLFRNEWWLATAGVEWDVLPGWTGVSLELRGGGSWLEREITHASEPISGGETPGTTRTPESEFRPVIAAGLSVVHHLTPTLQVRARGADLWIDPAGDEPEHSPTLTLGLRILFR